MPVVEERRATAPVAHTNRSPYLITAMAPSTFVGLCRSANIAVPATPALRLQLLVAAGSAASKSAPGKPITESAAALAWARASLSNGVDPDTWPTALPTALHPVLQGLYALPPARPAVPPAPPASDFQRLADMIALWDPAAPGLGAAAAGIAPAAAAAAPPAGAGGAPPAGGINAPRHRGPYTAA